MCNDYNILKTLWLPSSTFHKPDDAHEYSRCCQYQQNQRYILLSSTAINNEINTIEREGHDVIVHANVVYTGTCHRNDTTTVNAMSAEFQRYWSVWHWFLCTLHRSTSFASSWSRDSWAPGERKSSYQRGIRTINKCSTWIVLESLSTQIYGRHD